MIDRRAIPPHATESTWAAPDGHRIRRIDWPGAQAAPRGSILFLPGRGDFYEKYLETLDHWHRSGWRVTAADWRGQAASGRLGLDPVTGHIDDFATWVNDLAAQWIEWKAARPGPHVLIGHSMGGLLALLLCAKGLARAGVLLTPAPPSSILDLWPMSYPVWPGLAHSGGRGYR